MLAYPEIQGWAQQESLVRKHFINSLLDMTLKQKLLIDPPNSVDAAVQYAECYVAAKTATDGLKRPVLQPKRDRVRMVRPEEDLFEEENGEEDEELVVEMVNLLNLKVSQIKKDSREILLLSSALIVEERGIIKRECPSPSLNHK